jgi:hypothetical protein
MRILWYLLIVLLALSPRAEGNLLRNGDFQDDWLTLLPELKNHHWNYTTEVFNRRDFNPDGWMLSGKWQWVDADRPRGQRRLILSSPSRAVQSVNWVTVNNSAKLAGWPDAGGYPIAEAVRSKNPLTLVRDLTFRVTLLRMAVPKDAVTLTVAWSASSPMDDPAGTKRSASASVFVPAGSYPARTIEVKLPAADWLAAAKKDTAFAAQGAQLPMSATCEIVYADKQAGTVELLNATLEESGPTGDNLLPHGGFERLNADSYPIGWSRPRKHRYFPPGIYYIFNTWHNSNSDNRGSVASDMLVPHTGRSSLRMNVPTGDEVCVVSDPIMLNQKEPRLIEVRTWIKTHQICMLQIDAEDQDGKRIDGFNFIHKNPLSIGTNDWRQIRQVFRHATPLKSIRLKLCARGMNGYTLGGTVEQPQQNAAGVLWWDDVELFEPESTAAELNGRGVKRPAAVAGETGPYLANLDFGEQLLGRNELTAKIVNLGPEETFALRLTWPGHTNPTRKRGAGGRVSLAGASGLSADRSGRNETPPPVSVSVRVGAGKPVAVRLPYVLSRHGRAYQENLARLDLVRIKDGKEQIVASSEHAVATWTTPLLLKLGALYLDPAQKQFARVNLGLTHAVMTQLAKLRLKVLRRGTGEVLKTVTIHATPAAIQRQRERIPDGLRDDFRNLLLTELDVSFLPVQPFDNPQHNWVIRATTIAADGKPGWSATSAPFCRLAHYGPQPAIRSVRITGGEFLINDRPWMPWGVAYGHNPVYEGPADSGKNHDLANLKQWSLYDRHGGTLADRSRWDTNCVRHVETGNLIKPAQLDEIWKKGLYASTVFLPPPTTGKPWPADYLAYLSTAPMVASVSRGPEEAFGYFAPMSKKQLDDVAAQTDVLRKATGKPVIVGHGGYWTRLELERADFFDIFDPETEPWYPAFVHTDLAPLVEGKNKVVWLRPQMYESVPFERWRYHVFVELMRGVRGWQIAHGPGDSSTFRGLHAELRHLQPAIYSKEKPPSVNVEPAIEHMVRKLSNKTIVIAATTHGLSFGNWRWSGEKLPAGRVRVTADLHVFSDESDGYHVTGSPPRQALCPHGIQNLISPRKWPAGSKLVSWVKLDAKMPPRNLVALVKADGRWTHAAAWGAFDTDGIRKDNARAFWFLRTFYRHARGFLGWGDKVPPYALDFLPSATKAMGKLPKSGEWTKLELPLETVGASGKLLDGIGFLHEGGRASWAGTVLVAPDGKETVVFGDHEDRPAPANLEKTTIRVAGLKKGAKVRVLFEDRTIVAADGYFVDDFRGVDLYQRYGGERSGYGNAPVALHVYEVTMR